MGKVKNDDNNQLYGRMLECCDIELAIESGQFKSLQDVLDAIKARGKSLNDELTNAGFFQGNRIVSKEYFFAELTATEVSLEGLELMQEMVDESLAYEEAIVEYALLSPIKH